MSFEFHVIERGYQLTPDLSFLDISRPPADLLEPFQFTAQATFTTQPNFAGSDDEPYFMIHQDRPIDEAVAQAIRQGRLDNVEPIRILSDMREFTALQRFFRLALDGDLGQDFPLQRLVELQAAGSPSATPASSTPEWEVPPESAASYSRLSAPASKLLRDLGVDDSVAAERAPIPLIRP